MRLLHRHKLVGFAATARGQMTESQRTVLEPHWRALAARQLAHRAMAGRARAVLREQGIDAVLVKGAAQQDALYGPDVLRDSVDLDIWVGPGKLPEAIRALADLDFQLHPPLGDSVLDGPIPNGLPVFHPDADIEMDVHARLFPTFYAFGGLEEALVRNRDESGLTLTGHRLMAIATGAKDLYSTGRSLLDLTRIPPEAHPTLVAACDRARIRGLADAGMLAASLVFGRPMEWPVARPVDIRPILAALERPLDNRPTLQRARTWLSLRESLASRLMAVGSLPFAIRYQDLLEGGVDRTLHPLSRLLRLSRTYRHPSADRG